MAHDADMDETLELGNMFNQQTVIHVKNRKQRMIYTTDTKLDNGQVAKKGMYLEGTG